MHLCVEKVSFLCNVDKIFLLIDKEYKWYAISFAEKHFLLIDKDYATFFTRSLLQQFYAKNQK